MKQLEQRIDAMNEILNDLEISIPEQKVKELTEAFTTHLELEREIQSNQFIGHTNECATCASLKSKLEAITKERDIYHDSVCQRRNTSDVWIENDRVMFNK